MASGPRRREFDLNESIVDRLRDLASRYPKGLGLIKEFLQNADDAGASVLRVYYDQRVHPGEMPDPSMQVALGPALLFVNDSQFTDNDLNHIQTISNSSKIRDAGRTGRFGQGFNTSYSVSDHPSLVTGDTIVWFDPHRSIQDRSKNAHAWDLRDAAQCWPAWAATFAPAGVDRQGASFHGTVFRLPLRTPETVTRSKIRKEAFSVSDWEDILAQLRQVGPALLVFLRSVLALEAYDISKPGKARLRVRICTVNAASVQESRKPLRSFIAGQPATLVRTWLDSKEDLPSAKFTQEFSIEAEGEAPQLEVWEVVSEVVRGQEDVLLREALELCELDDKVLPWAGAAWRREGTSSLGKGGFACFLPLPDAEVAPVWLHGWFATDSGRRGLERTVEANGLSKSRVQWNRSLLEHGVGPAWAKLVMRLCGDANTNDRPYDLWPLNWEKGPDLESALSKGFYREAGRLPVLRVRKDVFGWQDVKSGPWDLPAAWHGRLEAPFRAHTIAVTVPPLSEALRRQLSAVGCAVNHLTPALMRGGLQKSLVQGRMEYSLEDAPAPWLTRREWVIAMGEFCSSDSADHLEGLPVALLSGNRLRCFSSNAAVYIASESQRGLLAPVPHRILDPEFQDAVFKNGPAQKIGVRPLDVAGMVDIAWEVVEQGRVTPQWLQVFFELLEQAPPLAVRKQEARLKALRLIPGRSQCYKTMGGDDALLLPGDLRPRLEQALARLGVGFIDGPQELLAAIGRFVARHQGFIKLPTANVIADMLVAPACRTGINLAACDAPEVRGPLLDLLASIDWGGATSLVQSSLTALPIFATLDGRRVAVRDQGVYAPGGLSPPAGIAGSLLVLDLGPEDRWRRLAEHLGVKTLDGFRFVKDVLLPAFGNATQAVQEKILVWLRDELPRIEASLDSEPRQSLRDSIRHAPIIPVQGGGFAEPARVYAPDASEPDALLGRFARKPDPRRFNTHRDLWRRFFETLNLPRQPLAADIHAAILENVDKAKEHGAHAVLDPMSKLAMYIDSHWDELASSEVTPKTRLDSALRELAWLPARRSRTVDHAAARVPEDCLYLARDLAAFRIRHLISSQFYLVGGDEFGERMAEGIGLHIHARPEEVLAHFDSLRRQPLSGSDKSVERVRTSFIEIMRYFGGVQVDRRVSLESWLKTRGVERSILIGRQWLCAEKVFLKRLKNSLPGAASIHDDTELARALESHGFGTGLEKFGVRDAPTSKDWVAVLNDLAHRHGAKKLPLEDLRVARGALLELRCEDASWLTNQTVWVPTQDGRLSRACDAFVPDDPRLQDAGAVELDFVEEIQEILDVARQAGSRSLRGSLHDRLHPETLESLMAEHRLWCGIHERRIRSRSFQDALARIEYDEGLCQARNGLRVQTPSENLGRMQNLRIRVAEQLRVQSVLHSDGSVVVFDEVSAKFLDEAAEVLWVNASTPRRRFDELVRAVCKLCGVGDMLIVSRLIDAEPEQMHALLTEDGIAKIPTGRSLSTEDLALHEGAEEWDEFSSGDGESMWSENEHLSSSQDAPGEMALRSAPITLERYRDNASRFSEVGSSDTRFETSVAARERTLEVNQLVDPDMPRPLSHGSSNPWSPERARLFSVRGASGNRLGMYAHPAPQTDYDTGSLYPGQKAQSAAIALVAAHELKEGRPTTHATSALDGYDLVSGTGAAQRFVRVRGIDGPWTARGIGLLRRDVDASMRENTSWWLYVVEHALDPKRASVFAIRAPLSQTEEFRLDAGWRARSEVLGDSAGNAGAPRVGEVIEVEGGRSATVLDVEHFDSVYEVQLEFSDGERTSCVWRASWRQGK
ncbi:sacsin N-terminal ATP-binding-like domain-containing protein [Corallococcus sp. M7]